MNLSEPEPKLRARLQEIYDNSESDFVKENVAAFVNMTPETFSGVYANAIKETHWLSYPNYAALVSGSTFSTDDHRIGKDRRLHRPGSQNAGDPWWSRAGDHRIIPQCDL
jgi:type IV secretion system protein VirD4